jgi:hypothetical protein
VVDAPSGEGTTDPAPSETPGVPPAASAYICSRPCDPVLGDDCAIAVLANEWRLDPGWLQLVVPPETGSTDDRAPDAPAVSVNANVLLLAGSRGETLSLAESLADATRPRAAETRAALGSADSPLLVVLTGGADLDAADLADLWAVIVVDDGSVRLDGTTLSGAVFATGAVELGATGQVSFSRAVLRWASDRSLTRVRLVPGTRWEGTE